MTSVKRSNDETLLENDSKRIKVWQMNTLDERLDAFVNGEGVKIEGSFPTNDPKVVLLSTGSDKYNKVTMSQAFYDKYKFNLWTMSDMHVQKVKVGDIVLQTSASEDNYNNVFRVSLVKFIPETIYYKMYRPIDRKGHTDAKNYRNFVVVLDRRVEVAIPKNVLHSSLGFKGIQSTHFLEGHYFKNLSKQSVPYKWCMKNNVPIEKVYEYYDKLRDICFTKVYG